LKDDTESEITEFFDKLRRDATVSKEQIQQMANSFKGASETMGEVMARLKSAMEEIKTLNKTVSTLTENNKMLVETIKAMGGTPPEAKETPKAPHPNKCPHCGNLHKKAFRRALQEIEKEQ
jgi:methyl-accepting chemotaxis protein